MNILFCGIGGQGIVFLSHLIAKILLEKGFNVKTTETIGMAQKGGSVVSHLRFGKENLKSAMILKGDADLIISLDLLETVRNKDFAKEKGEIITNTKYNFFNKLLEENIYGSFFTKELTLEYTDVKKIKPEIGGVDLKNKKMLNILFLGYCTKLKLLPFNFMDIFNVLEKEYPKHKSQENIMLLKQIEKVVIPYE